MKRKPIITILAVVLMLVLSIAVFTACNNKNDDKHEYSSEWKYDETSHWHECTTKEHSDVSDKSAHDFNAGEITKQPTEEAEGVKTFTCNTCGYQKTEAVAKLTHVHTYSSEWSKDETNHWHAATCAHTTEKKDVEAHQWNDGVVTTPATEEAAGVKTFTCTVCEQTKTEPIEQLAHTHKYDMTTWVKTDASGHYRPTTCGHEDKTKDFAEHEYTDDDDFDCNVCGYVRQATVDRTLELNVNDKEYTGETNPIKPSEMSEWARTAIDYVAYKAKGAPDTEYVKASDGGVPKAVGEYTVKVVTKGNAVYRSVEKTADFAITQKGIRLSSGTYIVYDAGGTRDNTVKLIEIGGTSQVIAGETVLVEIETIGISVGSTISVTTADRFKLTGADAANYRIAGVDCSIRVEVKKIAVNATVKVDGVENSEISAKAEIVYGETSFKDYGAQGGIEDYLDSNAVGKNVTITVYMKGNNLELAKLERVGNQYNYGGYTPATGGPGTFTYEFRNYYWDGIATRVQDYKWVHNTDSVDLVFDIVITEPTNIYTEEVNDATLSVRESKATYAFYKIALDSSSSSKTITVNFSLDETNADCAALIYNEAGQQIKALTDTSGSYSFTINQGEVYYVYVLAQRVSGTTATSVTYSLSWGEA